MYFFVFFSAFLKKNDYNSCPLVFNLKNMEDVFELNRNSIRDTMNMEESTFSELPQQICDRVPNTFYRHENTTRFWNGKKLQCEHKKNISNTYLEQNQNIVVSDYLMIID